MSDAVMVAVVTALGGIIVAAMTTFGVWIIPKLKRIDRNARQANEQVSNDHVYMSDDGTPILDRLGNTIPINLRVDQDTKHEENRAEMREFKEEVKGAIHALTQTMNNGFAIVNVVTSTTAKELQAHQEMLDELERTIPKAELGKGKHRV